MSTLAALVVLTASGTGAAAAPPAYFDWFEYTGHDSVFDKPAPEGSYRNPILPGFYPDPSITRANGRFYLVNSTFTYFPGLPVFESEDLVHWRQIGHVVDRPTEVKFDGLGVSRGLFAPAITYHAGIFYVVNTAVDSGGNFLVTAREPAGPWSDPIWLREIDGIDPFLFFDSDGRAYLLNNGPPAGRPQYAGHRAIWIQELDLATRQLIGPRKVLVNGGVDFSKQPVWIEGPRLYRHDGWYILMCAEGGTSVQHSEVVLRARSPWGPFEPFAGNPILTQRDLPADRPDPIINAGHADLVEGPDGAWWAVLLASRPYEGVHYNTGRETFLLPVSWHDGWPVILPHGEAIPYVAAAPKLDRTGARGAHAGPRVESSTGMPPVPARQTPTAGYLMPTGNFTSRDDFDSPALRPEWVQVRVPKQPWFDLTSRPGWLTIHASPAPLEALTNPSFLARRQQHLSFDASTELEVPTSPDIAVGLAAFQSENAWYFLGVRRCAMSDAGVGRAAAGEAVRPIQLFLEKRNGAHTATVARRDLENTARVQLRISGNARAYSFYFRPGEGRPGDGQAGEGGGWKPLTEGDDGSILSTDVAGGFVGTVIGPYARRFEAP